MKERVKCNQCNEIKNHSIHLYDHDFIDPRPIGISPIGKRMTRFNESEDGKAYRAHARELKKGQTTCQIQSPVCTGIAQHQHEDITRGKAGGIDASIRKGTQFFPACNPCNAFCSENQVWARQRGFIVRARDIR